MVVDGGFSIAPVTFAFVLLLHWRLPTSPGDKEPPYDDNSTVETNVTNRTENVYCDVCLQICMSACVYLPIYNLFIISADCNCDRNAECLWDIVMFAYRCVCLPGFTGEGRTCSRIG